MSDRMPNDIDWPKMTDHELELLAEYGNTAEIVVAARCEQARRNRYDKTELDLIYDRYSNAALPEESACPECGERHPDVLIWREDESGVECRRCGHYYDPNA